MIGHHSIKEAISVRPKKIGKAFIEKESRNKSEIKTLVQDLKNANRAIEVIEIGASDLDKYGSHQGCAITVSETPVFEIEKIKKKSKAIVMCLDGITDPHNFGAILRTSWLMGVSGIIMPDDRTVRLSPIVNKVACGAVEHVPVLFIANFRNILEELKENQFWVYGLSHLADTDLFGQNFAEKVVWIIGNEEKGMRNTTTQVCDQLVKIPQISADASYNASVAAAIALTETKRQHLS